MRKNNDIQVLRGIAITLVVMQHCRNRLPTPEAYHHLFDHFAFWSGVDVFFAISGFLIFQTFSRTLELSSGPVDALTTFAKRRFARLFPAAFFWILASVALSLVVTSAPYNDPVKIATSGLAGLFALSNAYYVYYVPDLVASGNPDFNGVTWSLSAEWQMYAVLAASILFVGRARAVLLLLLAAVIMSCFDAPSWSALWAFRIQAFALGALTAALVGSPVIPRLTRTWSILLLMLGVAGAIWVPANLPQPFVLPGIAIAAWACLIAALRGDSFSGALMKPMYWIGERSYSIYLSHLLVILSVREILTRTGAFDDTTFSSLLGFGAALVGIAVTGHLSYRFIEQRFSRPSQSLESRVAPQCT